MTARETGQDSGGKTVFFSRSYDEALALVREARSYLAGPGQLAVRKLPPEVGYAYAAESLRLTTRLTESMSWLMFQRALQEGEMTPEEAQREECHLQHFKVWRMRRYAIRRCCPTGWSPSWNGASGCIVGLSGWMSSPLPPFSKAGPDAGI